jgi:SAM-dependent methyltransferase
VAGWRRRAYDGARRVARLPDADTMRSAWPYLVPGAPSLLDLRWRRMVRRAPVVTAEDHAAAVGLGEIEHVIGCSLCGEQRMRPLLRPRAPNGRWAYDVAACPACGLLYRHPGIRPERLADLYASGYSSFLSGAYEAERRRRYELVMDAFGRLFADGAGRRVFDFGCGNGLFLRTAHDRGFDGFGVDLAPDAIEQARKHPGSGRTWCGAPHDVPEIAAGGFDVVTMWSVLAHLTDPVEDVTMLRRLLAPEGVLLLLTVNANSLFLRAQRDGWTGFTENHLKIFSPETLPLLFRKAGFGAAVLRPTYIDKVEAGIVQLAPRDRRRLRRTIERGIRGNTLRAAAFVDPDGPARWGLEADAIRLA